MAVTVKSPPKKTAPARGTQTPGRQDVISVSVGRIALDDKNARDAVTTPADKAKFSELVASIKIHGVLQPICLYDPGHPSVKQAIVYGHRRLMAAIEAGLKEIPATILDHAPDAAELQAMRWDENQQRLDLNPIEKAVAVEHRVNAFNGDVAAAARAMGWTERQVRDQLYLQRLSPKVRGLVIAGTINAGQARQLVKVPDAPSQERLAKEIAACQADGSQVSIEELQAWIEDLQRPLGKVLWKLEIPFAGKPACSGCPHNSDNDLDLFGAVKGESTCAMAACYDAKKEAAGEAGQKTAAKVQEQIKAKRILPQDAATIAVAREFAAPFMRPEAVQNVIKATMPAAKPAAGKPAPAAKDKKEKGDTELQRRQKAILDWSRKLDAWCRAIGEKISDVTKKDPACMALALVLDESQLMIKHTNYCNPANEYALDRGDWKGRTSPLPEKAVPPNLAAMLDPSRCRTLEGLQAIAATNQPSRFSLGGAGPELAQRIARAFGIEPPPPPVFEECLPKDLQPKKDAAPAPMKPAAASPSSPPPPRNAVVDFQEDPPRPRFLSSDANPIVSRR